MLDARAIALQGIGYGAMPAAVQGFAHVIQVGAILGGGSGAAGVAGYKLPSVLEYEDDIRLEILREDEEILAVIMSAVTSGAMKWVH